MSLIATLERAVVALERIANALESRPANDVKTPRKPSSRSDAEITELVSPEESDQDHRNRIVEVRMAPPVALAQALLRQISDGNPLAMATALRLAEAVLADVIDSESRTA